MTPSWPCEVNGSSATSHSTPSSGTAFFSAATARQTRLPGLSASLPSASFRWAGTAGKTATVGMPSSAASPAASTSAATGSRKTPGIDGTGFLRPSSCTKTGQIRSPAVSTLSATSLRDHGSRRLRRRRVCGYGASGGKNVVTGTLPGMARQPPRMSRKISLVAMPYNAPSGEHRSLSVGGDIDHGKAFLSRSAGKTIVECEHLQRRWTLLRGDEGRRELQCIGGPERMHAKKPRRRFTDDVARIHLVPAGRQLLQSIEGECGGL